MVENNHHVDCDNYETTTSAEGASEIGSSDRLKKWRNRDLNDRSQDAMGVSRNGQSVADSTVSRYVII